MTDNPPNYQTYVVHRAILADTGYSWDAFATEALRLHDHWSLRADMDGRDFNTRFDLSQFIEKYMLTMKQPFIHSMWDDLLDNALAEVDWMWLANWHVNNALDCRDEAMIDPDGVDRPVDDDTEVTVEVTRFVEAPDDNVA